MVIKNKQQKELAVIDAGLTAAEKSDLVLNVRKQPTYQAFVWHEG